jgi:hypothetical protein
MTSNTCDEVGPSGIGSLCRMCSMHFPRLEEPTHMARNSRTSWEIKKLVIQCNIESKEVKRSMYPWYLSGCKGGEMEACWACAPQCSEWIWWIKIHHDTPCSRARPRPEPRPQATVPVFWCRWSRFLWQHCWGWWSWLLLSLLVLTVL